MTYSQFSLGTSEFVMIYFLQASKVWETVSLSFSVSDLVYPSPYVSRSVSPVSSTGRANRVKSR